MSRFCQWKVILSTWTIQKGKNSLSHLQTMGDQTPATQHDILTLPTTELQDKTCSFMKINQYIIGPMMSDWLLSQLLWSSTLDQVRWAKYTYSSTLFLCSLGQIHGSWSSTLAKYTRSGTLAQLHWLSKIHWVKNTGSVCKYTGWGTLWQVHWAKYSESSSSTLGKYTGSSKLGQEH